MRSVLIIRTFIQRMCLFSIITSFLFKKKFFDIQLQIIERSLPKKQIVKKDPSVIEKEELEKIGKLWVNIARRDIPKHHRLFTNFQKKRLADAKRFSETCQREVFIFCVEFAVLHVNKNFSDILCSCSKFYIYLNL